MAAAFPNARTLRNQAERQERVLLALKYVSDELALEGERSSQGVTSGISLRILARTEPDGRTSIAVSLYHRVHRMRASGKAFHYWAPEQVRAIARTKQDLLVLRDINRSAQRTLSRHLFSHVDWTRDVVDFGGMVSRWVQSLPDARALEGPDPAETRKLASLTKEILDSEAIPHLGAVPSRKKRFPLWAAETHTELLVADAASYMPFLDAENYAQVAKNLFGVRAYRKPLAGFAERVDTHTLSWFQLFRGLVPIDWIIDALHAYEEQHEEISAAVATKRATERLHLNLQAPKISASNRRQIRTILRQVPEPVLRRLLKEPVGQASQALRDTAASVSNRWGTTRDITDLQELIAARGQRNIRGARDLEQLIYALPSEQQWCNNRQRAAGQTMSEESALHREMREYNEQIARLPVDAETGEPAAPVATWELWKDAAFRQAADVFLAERRRELMTAREREYEARAERDRLKRLEQQAERHAWAVELAARIDGSVVLADPQLTLVVAHDAQTLRRWGAEMHHCIGSYSHELDLDVFATLQDSAGVAMVAMQITQRFGVQQILGTNNRDAKKALGAHAQRVIDALVALGIEIDAGALGMHGLLVPNQALVAA